MIIRSPASRAIRLDCWWGAPDEMVINYRRHRIPVLLREFFLRIPGATSVPKLEQAIATTSFVHWEDQGGGRGRADEARGECLALARRRHDHHRPRVKKPLLG
jgi:hypothetical protein